MATKFHCDACDAIVRHDADKVAFRMESGGISLSGNLHVMKAGFPAMICEACLNKMFIEQPSIYGFPILEKAST